MHPAYGQQGDNPPMTARTAGQRLRADLSAALKRAAREAGVPVLEFTECEKWLVPGWTTRKRANGDTEWIPPPHLDHGQPRDEKMIASPPTLRA
jgi:hypothetical protein